MSEQQSLFQEPDQRHRNNKSKQHSVQDSSHAYNPDPRENPHAQERQRSGREYQEGYDGQYSGFTQQQMQGEKLQPRQQPKAPKRRQGPLIAILVVALILGLALFSGAIGGKTSSGSSFTVTAKPKVIINNPDGDVRIKVGAENTVSYDYSTNHFGFSTGGERSVVDAGNFDNTVRINITNDTNNYLFGGSSTALEVTVPQNADIEIRSGDGDVRVENVQGNLQVINNDGNIRVDDVNSGDGTITLKTVDGTIDANNVSGQVNISTNDGNIDVNRSNLTKQSSVSTIDGNIEFDGSLDTNGTYTFSTQDGNVEIDLPESSSFKVEATAQDGQVKNEFGSNSVGTGQQAQVTVSTGDGNVAIEKR